MTLLLALVLLGQVPGSVTVDPALNWYTFETANFAVHFSSPNRHRPEAADSALGHRVALLCEEAHAVLVPFARWTPRERTDVVVADFFDYANGWAAPVPRNTITIIPTLPAGNRVAFDDWLYTLIVHEYAHVLQLDMIRGVPAFLRRVFGRAIVTGPLAPFWLIEGWAMKAESAFTGRGRVGSAEEDMMLRAAADTNRLLPVDRAAHYGLERWPGGSAPYLYGGAFYRWVEKHSLSSSDTIWPTYHRSRAGALPFSVETHARRVFGRRFPALWRDWHADLRRHADSVGRELEAGGLTRPRPVTTEGWYAAAPLWSRSGRKIYYLSRDGTEYPAIKAVSPATGATRVLHRGLVGGQLSLTPDNRLLFAERNVVRNYYEYSDLWALDLATGRPARLTRGLRASEPDCAPDSIRVVFVLHHGGMTDLAILDLRDGSVENITNTAEPTGYSRPRFSPDGRYIAVAVNRFDGRTAVEVLDSRTGWVIPVVDDRAVNLAPAWSPVGGWLYFVSDRSGVFNIHAWSPDRDALYHCTNARWGLFEPAVAPDNRSLAVTAFGPDGFDIAVLPLDPESWTPEAAPETREKERKGIPSPPEDSRPTAPTLYYYTPLPSLAPALWFPLPMPESDGWTFGAITLGWDALQRHRYTLAAGWRTGGRPGPRLIADYGYSGIRPDLALETDLALDRQVLGAFTRLPFRRTRNTTTLTLGLRAEREEEIGLRLLSGFARSHARSYRLSVAPEEGGTIGVSAALEHRSALGLRNRLSVFHDFRHWYRLPGRTSLRARVAFGVATGDASADSAWRLVPGPAALGVRGFAAASERRAAHVLLAGVETRTPLWRVERGIGNAPVFLSNFNAAAFVEGGLLRRNWLPDAEELGRARLGAGLELRADLILGHMVPAQLKAGAAIGTRPDDWPLSQQLYFGIESALIAGLLNEAGIVVPN
ncbi:MAG TPA: hypothetical protein ENN51_01930 [candidate division WOR-3 bacterium]|uniref:Bacterial surface antigen (D15) domain-containing protein n=1 Tax=candidate division WOR-3 bacterium TaxID=2052148 RepID=A0A7V0XEW9_UNCW3|nr:hypothetical protein [candidate division WOR-3 bacterium]